MLIASPCRLFGDRHLWTPASVALAEGLSNAPFAESPRYIHLHLHEINGAGTTLARIHLATAAGDEPTAAAVRDDPAAALTAAIALLHSRLETEAVRA